MVGEFAVITGLLSAFSDGKKLDEIGDSLDFLNWLTKNGWDDQRHLIESNQKTLIGVKALLNNRFEKIIEQLEGVSRQVATLSSRAPGLKALTAAFPSEILSEQALSIIKLMETYEAGHFSLRRTFGGLQQDNSKSISYFPGRQKFKYPEPRFLNDDLGLLVSLGLVELVIDAQGRNQYHATRTGSEFVNSLSEKAT